jgi:hypothetical protein
MTIATCPYIRGRCEGHYEPLVAEDPGLRAPPGVEEPYGEFAEAGEPRLLGIRGSNWARVKRTSSCEGSCQDGGDSSELGLETEK